MNETIEPQPPPKASEEPAVWDLVMKDCHDRDRFGETKYRTRLRTGNGRNFLVDSYQEILDAAVYMRGEIEERDKVVALIRAAREFLGQGVIGNITYPLHALKAVELLNEAIERLAS